MAYFSCNICFLKQKGYQAVNCCINALLQLFTKLTIMKIFTYKMSLIRLSYALILGLLFTISACKKDNKEPEPDPVTLLKSKITGNWQLAKGTITEYDANGKVTYTEALPTGPPISFYDFQSTNVLVVTDERGKNEFPYELSVTGEGRSKILLDGYDDYEISSITATEMNWVRDINVTGDNQVFLKRQRTEVQFKKP
jgi:hypothetical protein